MSNVKPLLLNRKCEMKSNRKDLETLRVPQLKKIAQDLKLSTIGLKPDLCERIRSHLDKNPSVASSLKIPDYVKPVPKKSGSSTKTSSTLKKSGSATNSTSKKSKQEESSNVNKSSSIKTDKTYSSGRIQKYKTLEQMLKNQKIANMRSLIDLSDDQLESLINIVKVNDGQIDMKDLLVDVENEDEKVKIIVTTMAEKLCRCIKKVGMGKSSPNLTEQQKIAICIKSIFNKKGITISKFQCLPTPMLIPAKNSTFVLKKQINKQTINKKSSNKK